ncbi:TetR/AcrR family transcriptional regulator [Cellulophaga sp. L1A9]|uniref:TetR/AcrR family transcriptional regulator n=1 Tax=Cellulophaga sp. L1A9 TaxID=2686362 RepID=UPI00131BCDA5|nr:TetR/AcrR family transcriptional regulator [Cellulophaga sp. L1A9]
MKEEIKKEAIKLFNIHGMSNVSMKQIADSLSMSAGNLQYHFKSKEILLATIYFEMYEENKNYILPENAYITLFHFEEMMRNFDSLQQHYNFFFNDIVNINKTYPEIAEHYKITNLNRFKEGRKLIDYYVETGRMLPESETINYDKTIHLIWMASTFWQAQKLVITATNYETNKCGAVEMLWTLLLPYLTDKGLEEYHQLRQFVALPKTN